MTSGVGGVRRRFAKRFGIGTVLLASAYFAISASEAHAAVQCGQFQTFNVGQSPNISSIVGNNGWGLMGSEQLCLNVQTNGSFSVMSNSVTRTSIASYPNILKGQSYGEATNNSGFPIQVSAVKSFPVTWNIAGTNASGTWDAAIELWATTYNPNGMQVNQADGTELMIWLNALNTTPGGLTPIGQMATGNVLWDVRASRWGSSSPHWNYVAYFPTNGNVQNKLNTDITAFILDTEYRNGGAAGGCQNGTNGAGQCLYPNWYFTSIQAGFEMANGGVNLASSNFSATVNGTVPAPLYGQTAITGDINGNLDVFYPEYDGSLKYEARCYYGSCTPGAWLGETALGPSLAKQVTAHQEVSGLIDVFYNDPSTSLIHYNVQCTSCSNGWQGEQSFGSSGKQLTAFQLPWSGSLQLFFADSATNALKYRMQCWGGANCGANNWTSEQTVGTAKAQQLAVIPDTAGGAYVFYTDPTTNALKYNQECPSCSTSSWWQGEKTVGSVTAKQIAAALDFTSGTIVVFYTNPSTGAVSYDVSCSSCSGGWSAPQTLAGTNAKQLSLSYNPNSGRLQLAFVGTDNLLHQYIETTAGNPSSWTALSTLQSPFRELQLTAAPDATVVGFGAGIDGSLEFGMQAIGDGPLTTVSNAAGPYSSRAYVGSP
jgi:hypothetical protein